MNFKHLEEVDETYLQHLWCCIKYVCLFSWLAIIIFIHGLVPFILTTTASDKIKELNNDLNCRNNGSNNE